MELGPLALCSICPTATVHAAKEAATIRLYRELGERSHERFFGPDLHQGPGRRSPPASSWGVMLQEAQSYVSQAPRLAVYPGLAIVLAAFAFNLLGDGLRDIFDPRITR